jgi:hypothetical protein
MKRTAIIAAAVILIASAARSETAIANAGIFVQGTLITWYGEARAVDGSGNVVDMAMSGNLTLFREQDVVSYYPWLVYHGTWSDSFDGSGGYGYCYTSAVVAQTASSSNTNYSSLACIGSPPPPPGCGANGTLCEQSESCPLILDLNGDGIHTTGLDNPVHFWIDRAGRNESTGWTAPTTEEAFLWMDLNNDHVAQVIELFGSRMIAPNGEYHAHGFEALEKYDRPGFGGDGDGQITHKDWLWARLKLWVDRNHDGVSQPTEISVPSSHRIVALNLEHTEGDTYDENGNELYIVGSYVVRVHGNDTALRLMADVEFKYIPN